MARAHCADEQLGRGANVRLQRQRRARFVAGHGQFEQFAVLGVHVAPAVRQTDRVPAVAFTVAGQGAQPRCPSARTNASLTSRVIASNWGIAGQTAKDLGR